MRGSRVLVVWKRRTKASRPPEVVGGPLFATAVVEVFINVLIEALPHRCWPLVVVVREGVRWPVVPVPWRRVWQRQAARVAVPQLGGAHRNDLARRDCSWKLAALGHAVGL